MTSYNQNGGGVLRWDSRRNLIVGESLTGKADATIYNYLLQKGLLLIKDNCIGDGDVFSNKDYFNWIKGTGDLDCIDKLPRQSKGYLMNSINAITTTGNSKQESITVLLEIRDIIVSIINARIFDSTRTRRIEDVVYSSLQLDNHFKLINIWISIENKLINKIIGLMPKIESTISQIEDLRFREAINQQMTNIILETKLFITGVEDLDKKEDLLDAKEVERYLRQQEQELGIRDSVVENSMANLAARQKLVGILPTALRVIQRENPAIESDRKKQQAYQQIVDAADQMERDRIRNIQEQEARNRARRHHGGGLFRYIVNPITNKRVSISSSLGKSIINNYLNTLR